MAANLTRDDLVQYFASVHGATEQDLDEDTPIFTSGLLSSFAILELLVYIEEKTGHKISPLDVNLDNLDSVGRIIRFVETKQ